MGLFKITDDAVFRSKFKLISLMTAVSVTILFSFGQTGWAAIITCDFSGRPCNGTEGNDIMKGNALPNDLFGLGGNDRMSGGAGFAADELFGGEGNDILSGEKDPDVLVGENGNDTLIGGSDNDLINGGPGADSFKCGTGDRDRIEDFNPGEGDTKSNDCERF